MMLSLKVVMFSLCGFGAFLFLILCSFLTSVQVGPWSLSFPTVRNRRLSGSGESDVIDNHSKAASSSIVVIYNRVPKTGSTTLTGLAYDLCGRNKFNVLHLNTSKNSHVLSLSDQYRFAHNLSGWYQKHPGLFHGHLAYYDFAAFGVSKMPIWINVVREPVDRLVSYYYFLRFGDNFRPHLSRRRQGDRKSIDECVAEQGKDCDPMNMWLQVPFFCGHASACWNPPGNSWALEQAKRHLVDKYFLVGVTEELEDFVLMLESTLPSMFHGSLNLYRNDEKSHLRKTFNKTEPSATTKEILMASTIYKAEAEFYQFAYNHFQSVKRRTLVSKNEQLVDRGQQFFFEKIRPRSRDDVTKKTAPVLSTSTVDFR